MFFFGGSNLGYGYVGLSDVVLYIIYIWNCWMVLDGVIWCDMLYGLIWKDQGLLGESIESWVLIWCDMDSFGKTWILWVHTFIIWACGMTNWAIGIGKWGFPVYGLWWSPACCAVLLDPYNSMMSILSSWTQLTNFATSLWPAIWKCFTMQPLTMNTSFQISFKTLL